MFSSYQQLQWCCLNFLGTDAKNKSDLLVIVINASGSTCKNKIRSTALDVCLLHGVCSAQHVWICLCVFLKRSFASIASVSWLNELISMVDRLANRRNKERKWKKKGDCSRLKFVVKVVKWMIRATTLSYRWMIPTRFETWRFWSMSCIRFANNVVIYLYVLLFVLDAYPRRSTFFFFTFLKYFPFLQSISRIKFSFISNTFDAYLVDFSSRPWQRLILWRCQRPCHVPDTPVLLSLPKLSNTLGAACLRTSLQLLEVRCLEETACLSSDAENCLAQQLLALNRQLFSKKTEWMQSM